MIKARILWFLVAMLLGTSTAVAQTSPAGQESLRVSIERDESGGEADGPYRRVNLTVQYDSPGAETAHDIIRSITVRSVRGGPTMLFSVTIPPGAPARKISLLIPALSTEDSYNVRLLAGDTADTAVIAQFDLSLDWPAELVTAQAFLDSEAYDTGDYLPPVWSNRTLQTVFVIASVACVLLGASLLIHHSAWRVLIATVTVIAAGAGLWVTVISEPTVVRRQIGDDGRLLLVSCLREGHCEILAPYTVPLYYNLEEMSSDNAVIRTPEKLLVRLKQGENRLFARPEPVNQAAATQSGI
jgi:hypothetical protein